MNYPIWDLTWGMGLLIAIVSVVHVFVSHFAVGGGLFLVLTEKKAYREQDDALLGWLKRHTKFFVLVTVVFGAVTGVGIWFTIGLIHPSGTSSLIHAYVWGWAIEWVFFFLEITAALLYLYGWERLDRKTHLWLGWIYFISAFMSMVIINGIITFMLTPGRWIVTHKFWEGFFNPTYFPSLFTRFAFSLALAGLYALITGTLQKDENLRGTVVKWGVRWIVPMFILLPFFVWWYVGSVPDAVWASAQGKMPTATRYANLAVIFAILTFVGSLVMLIKPKKVPFVYALVVVAFAFVTMWSFEFIREAIRKPYVIYDYMYDNAVFKQAIPGSAGMTVEEIKQNGVLNVAKWVSTREITEENKVAVGREIFRVECQICHGLKGYRDMTGILREKRWTESMIRSRLNSLDKMVNGVMPPFAGTDEEKDALAAFLATLAPVAEAGPAAKAEISGEAVFQQYCSDCHEAAPEDPLFVKMHQYDVSKIAYLITRLDSLVEDMPPYEGTDAEREALAKWIDQQFK